MEEFRQRVPEHFDRGQQGELMAKHVAPLADQFGMRRSQSLEGRERDFLEAAFLRDDVADHGRGVAEITVPEEVDYVIEVTRPGALRESTHLFAE